MTSNELDKAYADYHSAGTQRDANRDNELTRLCRHRTGIWCITPKHTCVYKKCTHVKICQDQNGKCHGHNHNFTGHLFLCMQSGCVHRCDSKCPYGIMGPDGIPTCFISCRVLSEQCTQMSTTEHGLGENAYKTFAVVPPNLLSGRPTRTFKRSVMSPEQCYRLVSRVVFDLLMGDMKRGIVKRRAGAIDSDVKKALKKYDKTCISTQMIPNAMHRLNMWYSLNKSEYDASTFSKRHHECYTSLCTFWVLKCSQSTYGAVRPFPVIKNVVLAILYMSRSGLRVKGHTVIKRDSILESQLPSVADLRLQSVFRKGAALTEGRQYVINCITHSDDVRQFMLDST